MVHSELLQLQVPVVLEHVVVVIVDQTSPESSMQSLEPCTKI